MEDRARDEGAEENRTGAQEVVFALMGVLTKAGHPERWSAFPFLMF